MKKSNIAMSADKGKKKKICSLKIIVLKVEQHSVMTLLFFLHMFSSVWVVI